MTSKAAKQAQPELPSILPAPSFLPPGPHHESGEHTGATLKAAYPARHRQILDLHTQGIGMIQIARILRPLSVNTVLAVIHDHQHQHGTSAEMDNTRAMALMRHARSLAVEGVIEDLSDDQRRRKVSARDKMLIAAISTDKVELLAGNATSRVEHVDGAARPAVEDFTRWLHTGAIDVPVEMDLTTRSDGTKETPDAAGDAAGATAGAEAGLDGQRSTEEQGPDAGVDGTEDGLSFAPCAEDQ